MKKHAVLLGLLLGAVILLWGCWALWRSDPSPPVQRVPEAALTYLSFRESSSYYQRVQGYAFRAEAGANTVYFNMANKDEPYPVPVDQAWVDVLTGFIGQYGMMAWDGFQGSAAGLLDGTRFELDVSFADGTNVHASGYGVFPKGYGDASAALDAHFMQLLPEDMRSW